MRDNDGWLCCVYIDRIFHYEKKERLNLMQDKMIKGSQLFCPSRFNCIVSLLLKKLIYNMNLFSLLHYFHFEILNLLFKELVQINDQS